jgi:ADP-ribose pyrophosphatase YjhB (NUDIX family)
MQKLIENGFVQRIIWPLWWLIRTKYLVGVSVVAIRGDHILIINKRLGPTVGWNIPGGGKDRGCSFEEQATKELFEETGIRIGSLYLVDVILNETHYGVNLLYMCPDPIGEPKVHDKLEIKEAVFVPIRTMHKLLSGDGLMLAQRAVSTFRRYGQNTIKRVR